MSVLKYLARDRTRTKTPKAPEKSQRDHNSDFRVRDAIAAFDTSIVS